MKLLKGSKFRKTSRSMFFVSIVLLATACSRTQDGIDIPTASNLPGTAMATASASVKVPITEEQFSGVTGSCQVSRNQNGGLVWSISVSGLTPDATGNFYIQQDQVGTIDGTNFQAGSSGRAKSGRHVLSPAPASGTLIQCGLNVDGFGGAGSSQFFAAP